MQITITTLTGDIFNFDVSEDLELENLKALCGLESGISVTDIHLLLNGVALNNNAAKLKDCGIKEGEMLLLQKKVKQATPLQPNPGVPLIDFSRMELPGPSHTASSSGQMNDPRMLRDFLLSNPHDLALLKERNPVLSEALLSGNLDKFIQVLNKQQEERAAKERERFKLITANPFDAEAQQKIAEEIRLKNVDSNMETAMEFSPESFGQVTMLYIDCKVNNQPVKAFVDSGAQMTIMSQACAERCNLMRLIDRRWSGLAKGVGVQTILGRIHLCQVEIGGVFMACSFSVLKDQSMEMLLGLDMLKRHQCIIDMRTNELLIGTTQSRTPFLSEAELPAYARLNSMQEGDAEVAASEEEQRAILDSINKNQSNSNISSLSSSTPNFSSGFPEASILQITRNGFSREDAITQLSQTGGNVEKALAILLARSLNFSSF